MRIPDNTLRHIIAALPNKSDEQLFAEIRIHLEHEVVVYYQALLTELWKRNHPAEFDRFMRYPPCESLTTH